jgi:hypothetical protein
MQQVSLDEVRILLHLRLMFLLLSLVHPFCAPFH